jgi:hypothetical protein
MNLKNSFFLFISLISISSPILAGPVMWRNIEFDMPAAVLMENYPETREAPRVEWGKSSISIYGIKIEAGCDYDAFVETDQDMKLPDSKVKKVSLSGVMCDNKVRNNLLSTYGEPIDKSENILKKTMRMTWVKDGVTIIFKVDRRGLDSWEINYRVSDLQAF